MHKSSSIAVIFYTLLIIQYVYSSPNRDDKWWNELKTRLESRQRNQWLTKDNKTIPIQASQTTRSIKRSSAFADDFTDSPFTTRSRNWEKSYAKRRDFDRTWRDDQPVRERFVETEWDDDVPVRHVFRDSMSGVDEGNTRNRVGDDIQPERMSRPWTRGDSNENNRDFGGPGMREVFISGRNANNNKNNNNSNNKPKVVTNSYDNRSQKQPKSDRTDRVLSLQFQDSDTKKKDRDRLDQLAKEIFKMDNEERDRDNGRDSDRDRDRDRDRESTRSNGNSGGGYVTNAVNSFSRNSGNSYATTNPGNDFINNSGNDFNRNKQNSNKFGTDFVKPSKPKFNVMFETTSAKPDRTSNTAKFNANDIRSTTEKAKSSTTPSGPSSQLNFGWRSSISHTNDNKNQNNKIQNNVNNEEMDNNYDDMGDDYLEDTTTTPRPVTTRAPTRTLTRATTKPMTIRTTIRPTIRTTIRPEVEYTTYRQSDMTRPQTTTTNKANNRENPFLTTPRPKAVTPKTSTNSFNSNISSNKKQHRMGSWVDSENLDYEIGDKEEFIEDRAPVDPIDDRLQPLIEEEEFEGEQLPERVEEGPEELPAPQPVKFGRQSAKSGEGDDDQPGWRLEDALPGVPGTDYGIFASVPKTDFDCKTHQWPGYYADVETKCQVFHICQTGGRKNSFLCPNGTMFNQQVFVCDWWHNVQCGDSPTHYPLNENIYDHNWESKRVTKTETDGNVRRSGTLVESEEPLTEDMATTASPNDSDSESIEDMRNTDNNNDVSNEFNEEVVNEETGRGRATRVRSPIRIYRTSRILTPPERQKRRRRKRGHLRD